MDQRPFELVSATDDGCVLRATSDVAVRELLLSLTCSKAVTARIIAEQRLNPQMSLSAGDTFEVPFGARDEAVEVGQAAPLDEERVLFDDPFFMAIDKPAGLLVHDDGTGAPTLTDSVRARLLVSGQTRAAGTLQAIQRLDVETTGCVLFSKTAELQPALDAQVAGHDMDKRYLAVVRGCFPDGERTISRPIGRDRHNSARMCVAANGKPATTRVRCLDSDGSRSLLLVELGSGRRHQIRVHLADLGFPVVGDALYGRSGQGELLLHAYQERLTHPVDGRQVVVTTPWPTRLWPTSVPLPD